jgi:hypothetical protein
MAKRRKKKTETKKWRPDRVKLTAEETLKRMEDFPKRREAFIAAIGKGTRRGVSA